ncbi:MarR family winged helix-turn-helix transcriptional regulator [Lactococcus taiwanensis]|uniref:MarR family transcriptional regulator n=1 Tax=Lactococcus taiwanensis TaxID=1151742 RepID=A0AA45KEU7_9LACT|nr:MarR family transcriptional regulator [Lactococcus taiwanensis]KZK37286.1 Transcriptional regulator MarR family [Lactococcus cremoris]QRZ11575.1 MarR family transcriptional regulator [Lactococcus taiwanensis]QSE76028.1 MarR family transcriptional regulator [Lactococcus taiwanensis]
MTNTIYSNLIRSISQKSMVASNQAMKDLKINQQQARVIAYIAENQDKGLIQKDLAEVFHRRGASITSMLQGLERNGYIERRIPKDNERQKNLYILPKGLSIVQQINQIFDRSESNLISSLTENERVELLRILEKIDQNL